MWSGNDKQKPVSDQYRSAWDEIFGAKKVKQQVDTDTAIQHNKDTSKASEVPNQPKCS